MQERRGAITFNGNPLTLTGIDVKIGDPLPEVLLFDNDLKPVKLSSFKGKVLLILSVPSLDTIVCSKESQKIDRLIAGWKNNVTTLVISKDLPFAQKRWCGTASAQNIKTLSDYKEGEFGQKFGVAIKELGLLARAAFVVDDKGIIRYKHLVKEVTNEPPYEEILGETKGLFSHTK